MQSGEIYVGRDLRTLYWSVFQLFQVRSSKLNAIIHGKESGGHKSSTGKP
jgi:hypothetical protein